MVSEGRTPTLAGNELGAGGRPSTLVTAGKLVELPTVTRKNNLYLPICSIEASNRCKRSCCIDLCSSQLISCSPARIQLEIRRTPKILTQVQIVIRTLFEPQSSMVSIVASDSCSRSCCIDLCAYELISCPYIPKHHEHVTIVTQVEIVIRNFLES